MQWQKLVGLFAIANLLPAGTLHLKTGQVTTRADVTDYQADAAKRFRTNQSHYLLQFRGPVSQEQIDLLATQGAMVTAAIPDNALMVMAGDDFSLEGLDLEFAGRLRPEQKLSRLKGEAYVVEFHSDVRSSDARELLAEQGLVILKHPDLQKNHYLVKGPVAGLADWDEVAYVFPASRDLVAGRRVYACASSMPSVQGMSAQGTSVQGVPMFVKTGDGWSSEGLSGATVQYVFSSLTPKVPETVVKEEITRALMEWPKHGNLHFVPGSDPSAPRTVAIRFASFDHGDAYPFDGPGGVLAHTFYPSPVNAEPIAGDMHLDASEDWHSGANVDLYTVALHEAGHALGLGHTDQPGAIMYPYYRMGTQISNDDIAGIESLYGPPNGSAPTPTPASQISLTIQNPAGAKAQTTSAVAALSGIVANAVGATQVNWQTDHGTSGVANGSASWSIAAVPLVTGTNTITVSAVDSLHKTASQSAVVTRSAESVTTPVTPIGGSDTTPPTITLTSPRRTIVQTNQAAITVSGVASDNVEVAKVTWQNTLSGSGTATGTTKWSAGIPLFPGTNTLILKAWDAAGNSSWRSVTVVRN
jgi:hypothetical protein